MKTLTLSLTDSFKLRNLLKTNINSVGYELSHLPSSYDKDLGDASVAEFSRKYGSPMNGLQFLMDMQETLGNLNVAIDVANVNVRPFLDRIEVLKQYTRRLASLITDCTSAQTMVKSFNNVTGAYDIIEKEKTFSAEDIERMDAMSKTYGREILSLEQQISTLNGSTCFQFEMDERIYDFIYQL